MKKITLLIGIFAIFMNLGFASTIDVNTIENNCSENSTLTYSEQNPFEKPKRRKIRSEYRKRSIWENRVYLGYGMTWNKFSGIQTESNSSGYTFEASYFHFILENLGIGMEASLGRCLLKEGDFNYEDKPTGFLLAQDINHQTNINYVGPSVMTRTTAFSNYLVLYASFSLGYASCNMIDRNKTTNTYDLSFSGLATQWKAGVDISIAENVYFSISGNYLRTGSSSFNSLLDGANHEFKLKDGLDIKMQNYGVQFGLVLSF